MDSHSTPKNNITTFVLVVLLVIASFFVGTLYTKVQLMEKNNTNNPAVAGAQANAQVTPEATPPTETIGTVTPVSGADHIQGPKDAQVVLIEYSDFECPFCGRFHETMKEVMTAYEGKIAWVFRQYPLPFHANAQKYAQGSECAASLGGDTAFWAYADKIFAGNQENANITDIASQIGLNTSAFDSCVSANKFKAKIDADLKSGQEAGIQGTPGTIILTKDGKKDLISGALPIDEVKAILDKYVK